MSLLTPLNLIDPDVLYELRDLVNQLEATNELKVIVFDSANPEFYIAHVDILREGETAFGVRILPDFMQRLSRLPIIIVCSIIILETSDSASAAQQIMA